MSTVYDSSLKIENRLIYYFGSDGPVKVISHSI